MYVIHTLAEYEVAHTNKHTQPKHARSRSYRSIDITNNINAHMCIFYACHLQFLNQTKEKERKRKEMKGNESKGKGRTKKTKRRGFTRMNQNIGNHVQQKIKEEKR